MSSKEYYLGIDVGTGSVRALLVERDGTIVASATYDTRTWRDPTDHNIFEQSTADIWLSIATVVKECLSYSRVEPKDVKGVGFDATCSLAVTDFAGRPIVVSRGNDLGTEGGRNVILWCDHRAEKEAGVINASGSVVLGYVGGTMSIEMEIPKILWLKNHMDPALFSRCQFFDLPDYLTYRATGSFSRSSCSLTCKCSYVPGSGWQAQFFEKIGLGDIVEGEYRQLSRGSLLMAGSPVGNGLSEEAALELGLVAGTPVGSGLIDAYAGWLGTIATRCSEDANSLDVLPTLEDSRHRLAAVAGTSTCFLVQSPNGIFVNGVWGPYKDAVFHGWWMNEGGQSSTGQLIEHIIVTHPAYPELLQLSKDRNQTIYKTLEEALENLRAEKHVESLSELTKDLHIYPDFHGNRSPIADPRMRGAIVGLDLNTSISDLARRYYATLESIAFQTRHIIEEMNTKGHQITTIYLSGGQAKNLSLVQLLSDVSGMPVVLPTIREGGDSEAVVLGAVMLGRFAAEVIALERGKSEEHAGLLWWIMVEMTPVGTRIAPTASAREKRVLEAKYKIFRECAENQKRWRKEMEQALRA